MSTISVIIVNYNVCHFLEQCLYSLRQASQGLQVEVWVVDNASTDGSVELLRPAFPEVKWIVNQENLGFAKANNQALQQAVGGYILFLNPDTLVSEDTLRACLHFMQSHPDAGALGVSMVDGSGRYLPESKRAFPSPLTSLFKLTGLATLFPRNAVLARYYLGHLPAHQNHEVEVLAGAYMFLRGDVARHTGGFDEQFFMYGEDIDLSYRILQMNLPFGEGRYKNYYLADTSIVHFKGESTKKGSLNYVRMFYQAMVIFVHKHYGHTRATFFTFFIRLAIWVRAGFAALGQLMRHTTRFVFDAALTVSCLWVIAWWWFRYVRPEYGVVPFQAKLALAFFTIIYLGVGALAGLYGRIFKPRQVLSAMWIAMLMLLAVYSMLPEQYRFSRGVIFIGGLAASGLMYGWRLIMVKLGWMTTDQEEEAEKQTLVAGSPDCYQNIEKLMAAHGKQHRLLGRLSLSETDSTGLMPLRVWLDNPGSLPVKDLIFCLSPELPLKNVLPWLSSLRSIRFKFHFRGSGSIVGSESSHYAGETMGETGQFALADSGIRLRKRFSDLVLAMLLLISWPLQCFWVHRPWGLLRNLVAVFAGSLTWIGYTGKGQGLPPLRQGVLGCNGHPASKNQALNLETAHVLDMRYATGYTLHRDWALLRKGWKHLGANPYRPPDTTA